MSLDESEVRWHFCEAADVAKNVEAPGSVPGKCWLPTQSTASRGDRPQIFAGVIGMLAKIRGQSPEGAEGKH
jgi:hypothetical protein